MRDGLGLLWTARPQSAFWGIVVPTVIFLISFVAAYALYRKFTSK
jgi:hypothetical protein